MNTKKIVLCAAFVATAATLPVVYGATKDLPAQYSQKPSVSNTENMQSRDYSRRRMLILKEKPEGLQEDIQAGT